MQDIKKKLLIIGLIGAALTMVGDFLLMGVSTYDAQTSIDPYMLAAQQISYTRIGLAAFFGYVGIPISSVGFLALCKMCEDKYSALYRVYRNSVIAFGVVGGGGHILCCFLMTGLKKNLEIGLQGTEVLTKTVAEQAGYLVPCLIVFFAVYFVFVISQILLIARHKTVLPAWAAFINPFTLKILLNMTRFMGHGAFANGLACSNMSFGAIVMFVFWLVFIRVSSNKRS